MKTFRIKIVLIMFITVVAVMGVAMIIGVVSISKLGSSDAEQTLLLVCDAEQ